MRRYELMLLLRPDLEDDKLQAAVEKVTRAIVNGGGSLSKVSPWGKRRLAYDIGRHREASYFLIHFDIEPGQVREIERGMLISEEILRHLVTVIEDRGPAEEVAPAVAPRSTEDRSTEDRSTEDRSGEDRAAEEPTERTDADAAASDAGGDDEPEQPAEAAAEAPAENAEGEAAPAEEERVEG